MIRILIVDDDLTTRYTIGDLIGTILRDCPHPPVDIQYAGSAEEAIGVLTNEDITLLITDYELSGLSGLELIRHTSDYLSTKKILLTDHPPSVQHRILGAEAGLEGIFEKPVRREDLKQILMDLF
ncbi:MAG: response regulator [Candidatus Manganitrophaceae bacterium]